MLPYTSDTKKTCKMNHRVLFAVIVFCTLGFFRSPSANAQDETNVKIFTAGRIGLTHSSELPSPGELYLAIGHRFGDIGGGFYDLFGLDLATIRLGFDYGINKRFAAGIGRSTWEKTYDLYLKSAIMNQEENGSPLSLTGVLTWSVNTLKGVCPEEKNGIGERSSLSGQLLIARRFGNFSFQVSPSVFMNNYEIRNGESLLLYYLPVTGSARISRRIALSAQYIPVFNRPAFTSENPLAFGIDIDTGGHQFQLLFSNSTGIFEKSLLTDTSGKWGKDDIYFGFNLLRAFYLGE